MRQCDHRLTAFQCQLPEGHDGPHRAERELPPDLNQFIGASWDEMVKARVRFQRWRFWFIWGTLVNVVLYVIRFIQ